MSTQTITAPVILDSTGQSILTALGQIKEAVQPTNSCLDIDISLPTTGWSGEGPYTYTYSNTHITSGCAVKVNFLESASSGGVLCLDYEKVTGGVRFTSDSVPTATIPVRIHVLNADATSTTATTADAVSTDAVSGASNVQDALTTLNTQITTINGKLVVKNQTLAFTEADAITVSGIGIIRAYGGTNGTVIHIKRSTGQGDKTKDVSVGAASIDSIPVCDGDKVYYNGGVWSAAALLSISF